MFPLNMRVNHAAPLVVLLVHLHNGGVVDSQSTDFQLTRSFLELTRQAVRLSQLVYAKNPLASRSLPTGIDSVQVFTDEPDQALVVSTMDQRYCFAVFRGTDASSRDDVRQNALSGLQAVCQNGTSSSSECCQVKRGFNEGYATLYQSNLVAALRQCVTNRSLDCNSEACRPTVVLTGHSQGGAIALAASLHLLDLSPTVITFGQPKAVAPGCSWISSDRIYRFENSRLPPRQRLGRSPVYDPVPHLSDGETSHYGHQILLSDDASAVAYLGLNADVSFSPWDIRDGFATHRLADDSSVGYISRIEALVAHMASSSFRNDTSLLGGLTTTGFRNGSPCTKDVECSSQQCSFILLRCISGSLWDRFSREVLTWR